MTIFKVFPRPFWPLKRPTRPRGRFGIRLSLISTQLVILTLFVSQSSSLLRSNLIPDENSQFSLKEDYPESRNLILIENDKNGNDDEGLFSEGHQGHDREERCIESSPSHEPKNFYYGEHAITLNILTSDRLSHKLVSNILKVQIILCYTHRFIDSLMFGLY